MSDCEIAISPFEVLMILRCLSRGFRDSIDDVARIRGMKIRMNNERKIHNYDSYVLVRNMLMLSKCGESCEYHDLFAVFAIRDIRGRIFDTIYDGSAFFRGESALPDHLIYLSGAYRATEMCDDCGGSGRLMRADSCSGDIQWGTFCGDSRMICADGCTHTCSICAKSHIIRYEYSYYQYGERNAGWPIRRHVFCCGKRVFEPIVDNCGC
jgi:hypothetical protein